MQGPPIPDSMVNACCATLRLYSTQGSMCGSTIPGHAGGVEHDYQSGEVVKSWATDLVLNIFVSLHTHTIVPFWLIQAIYKEAWGILS